MELSKFVKTILNHYRTSINPPYDSFVHLPSLLGTIIIILSLPIMILNLSIQKSNVPLSAQSLPAGISFLDDFYQPITESSSTNVKVQLVSPWPATNSLSQGDLPQNVMGIIDIANAQTSGSTQTYKITSSSDDVNQDGATFDTTSKTVWLGNGQSASISYTGLRFTNVTIPSNAIITSARLQVFSTQSQWINIKLNVGAHAIGNSPEFSATSKPSQRTLTGAKVNDNSNSRWNANTWYSLNDIKSVIQEIVKRSDWNSGNSLSLILKGSGTSYGRKFISSLDGSSVNAPRLIISYSTSSSLTPAPTLAPTSTPVPTATPRPTNTPVPTLTPTNTPVPPTSTPIPTPTPITQTVSAVISEDASFTTNLVTISPFPTNPYTTNYTLSDSTPGAKTLYVKFVSSTGNEQVFSGTIMLVSPSSTPTSNPTPTGMSMGSPTPGQTQNSHALGLWTPNPKYDTCTKEQHDSYKLKGPDGKWYPTWHPPVDAATGCKFGHEHGRNPNDAGGSALIPFINQQYGGVLFGYANEQLDVYNVANGITTGMRHEDHVGHKIEWENHVRMSESTTTGGANRRYLNIYCDFFMKAHQGTHSKDAFTNNLHELGYFVQCQDGQGGTVGTKIGAYKMVAFGQPGGFSAGTVAGGFQFVSVGTPNPPNSPTGSGLRAIPEIDKVKEFILVPSGTWSLFSNGIYEDWISANYFNTASGNRIAYFDPHFAVFTPSRYYWPGSDPNTYGITRTPQDIADNVGRSVDTCYMNENGGAEVARGGECTWMGNLQPRISYDDPRSVFNGVKREFYFNQTNLANQNGPAIWYTDPYGGRLSTTAFTGSIKQYVAPVNNNKRNIDGFIDPNGTIYPFESEAIGGTRNYGGNGVHAPN